MTPHLHLIILSLLLPTALSATCTTPKLTSTKFTTCTQLPSLTSALHYTYTPANKTLSVAFTATPPTSSGWVAWGINPSDTGMVGAQAFVAYKNSSAGGVSVATFNLTSYGGITPHELSFPVYSKRAEFNAADGSITIYASVKSDGGKVNHVWQVGPGLTKGLPDKHDMKPANLQSKDTIDVSTGVSAAADSSGELGLKKRNVGSSVFSLALVFVFFVFL